MSNICNRLFKLKKIKLIIVFLLHSFLPSLLCHFWQQPVCPLNLWTGLCGIFVVIIVCFLASMYKRDYTVFTFPWFISLDIMLSKSIHVAANGKTIFFFMAEYFFVIDLCVCVCVCVCIVLTSGSVVKNPLAMWETQIWPPGEEDPLEKEMATHSSILAWKVTWMKRQTWLSMHAL